MPKNQDQPTDHLKTRSARYQVWARFRSRPDSYKIGVPITAELAKEFVNHIAGRPELRSAILSIERVERVEDACDWADEIEFYLRAPAHEERPSAQDELNRRAGDRICAGRRSPRPSLPPRRSLPPRPRGLLDRFMCERCVTFERWVIFCILTVLGGSAALIALDHFIGL